MFIHLDIWKFLNVEILYSNIIFWDDTVIFQSQIKRNQTKPNETNTHKKNNQKIKNSGFNTWGLIFYSQCALVFLTLRYYFLIQNEIVRINEKRSIFFSVCRWVKLYRAAKSTLFVCVSMLHFADLLWILTIISHRIFSVGVLCLCLLCHNTH